MQHIVGGTGTCLPRENTRIISIQDRKKRALREKNHLENEYKTSVSDDWDELEQTPCSIKAQS